MRLVLVFLIACGSEDPHGTGTCDTGWTNNGFTSCETACENSSVALNASGAPCEARTIENNPVSCSKTFTFEDALGCCSTDGTEVHFADCN